jgi:predicted phosphodiesterase
MKIAIVSDIHANIEALSSIPEPYDELWVLGDLVAYGPSPGEVIDFVRSRAAVVIRGNHDHAVAFNTDPHCSPDFRVMAGATLAHTRAELRPEDLDYLSKLPVTVERIVDGTRFFLCHAAPSDPLYKYVPPDSGDWDAEVDRVCTDVLLVGHTHKPFVRCTGDAIVVNPGSLGQPKTGNPLACYAIWDRGIELHSFEYPVAKTIARIERMPVPRRVRADLIAVLQSGGAVLV